MGDSFFQAVYVEGTPPWDIGRPQPEFARLSDDADRERYVRALHLALRQGGRVFLMCFSDQVPGDRGPRRVTQGELRGAFRDGWRVDAIDGARFEVNSADDAIHAWLASLTRL